LKPFLIFVLLLAPFTASAAVWYDEYDAGLKAIAARDWTSAETRLKTALSLQSKQGRRVFAYGVRFIRYIPHYYLSVANFNQGRYQDALNQLHQIQKTGLVVNADPEFSEMNRMIQVSEEHLKPKKEETPIPPPAPPPAVEKPETADTQKAAERFEEEEKRKQEQFVNLIKKAEDALSEKDFKQSRELAKQAAAMGLDETRIKGLSKRIDLSEKLDALERAVNKKDWPAAQKAAQQVVSFDPGNRELTRLQSLIERGLSEMKAQELEDRGLLAFLSGDYQQAIILLERVANAKEDSAETWFYLGCSHAAIGFLQGKEGQPLLQKAQREFEQVRKLDPKFKTTPGFISPRIVELYRQAQ